MSQPSDFRSIQHDGVPPTFEAGFGLSARPQTLGFTGQYGDPASALYPLGNGYRFYHPALMRFTAPDDLSPFGAAGPNAYAYCAGDPVNYADPTGHIRWPLDEALGNFVSSVKAISAKKGIEGIELDSLSTLGDKRNPLFSAKQGKRNPLLDAHPQEELQRRPLRNTGPYQRPAHPNAVFNLAPAPDASLEERRFLLHSANNGSLREVKPNGHFIYVIPYENPTEIRLASLLEGGHPTEALGHTSLMQQDDAVNQGLFQPGDVLYAGTMEFDDGVLVEWNNVSGHYQPPGDQSFVRANVPAKWRLLLGTDTFSPFVGSWVNPIRA